MLHTLIYKFKKRELTDTPPDITATNSNWDITENELDKISKQRGYLSSRGVTDANDLVENGKYTSVRLNTPTNDMWNIDVTVHNDKFLTQVATLFANPDGFKKTPKIAIRNKGQGIWEEWVVLSTASKEEIQLTPLNGWEKTGNDLCRLIVFGNNVGLLQLELKATKPIANVECVKMEFPYVPRKSFSPIIYDIGGRSSKGYVYNNGSVKISDSANTNEILTMNMVIDLI